MFKFLDKHKNRKWNNFVKKMREVQILPFIKDYMRLLSESLAEHYPAYRLTNIQKLWLSFCLTGILLTNSVCWARFERASFGG